MVNRCFLLKIPHVLAYVGFFLYFCDAQRKLSLHVSALSWRFLPFSFKNALFSCVSQKKSVTLQPKVAKVIDYGS